jgi:hypothetical protein
MMDLCPCPLKGTSQASRLLKSMLKNMLKNMLGAMGMLLLQSDGSGDIRAEQPVKVHNGLSLYDEISRPDERSAPSTAAVYNKD